MNLTEARILLKELMKKHNIKARTYFGYYDVLGTCKYCSLDKYPRIFIDKHLIEQGTDEEVKDTMLHEIAHAMRPSEVGHPIAWRIRCLLIGCRPFASRAVNINYNIKKGVMKK